ncbi:hypothetical protein [Larkinella sp.]|uniref:hypothetical protein n=1 Tax=Larkinella sp. TaxID=2034517 RepID=UPI003BAB1DAF
MTCKIKLSIVCFLLGLFWSCQSKKQPDDHHHHAVSDSGQTTGPVAELEKEVLAVHDSLMLQMTDLMRMQEDVSVKVEKSDRPSREKGEQVLRQLKEADEVMMDWMHQYKGDTLKQLDQEKALDYLKIQQGKVNALSRLMRQRLTDAQNYLKE